MALEDDATYKYGELVYMKWMPGDILLLPQLSTLCMTSDAIRAAEDRKCCIYFTNITIAW
jgi:hypothetical protein